MALRLTAADRPVYHRMAMRATKRVQRAVERGLLPDLFVTHVDCVDCKVARATQYDHRDYGKPLEVEPVCGSCNLKRGKAEMTNVPVRHPSETYPSDCPKCGYSWAARVESPKACPRCKTRLDVEKPSCPYCSSSQVYYRIKSEDYWCRLCDKSFEISRVEAPIKGKAD